MKFLKKTFHILPSTNLKHQCQNYIYSTKVEISQQLPHIFNNKHRNITIKKIKALKHLRNARKKLTVKPADKNLGIVVLDTNDYIEQCITQLSSNSYQLAEQYSESLPMKIRDTIINFK